jgi:flagellar basal-body rod modification protein FlgD
METTRTPAVSVNVNARPNAGGLGGISGTDFMNILVKQLQMQDPMKPMSNQEMVAQLSTIRELEMNTRLAGRLEQLTDQQRFGSAAVLLGKHVKGAVADADGTEFEVGGIVTGVRFTPKGEVLLELDSGEYMPMSALAEVKNADGTLAFSM